MSRTERKLTIQAEWPEAEWGLGVTQDLNTVRGEHEEGGGGGSGCPPLTHAASAKGVLASDWSFSDFGAYQRGMCNLSAR